MVSQILNVLLTSFPGLQLPSTLSLALPADTSIHDLANTISTHLPDPTLSRNLILTTTSNRQLDWTSTLPLSTLLPNTNDASHTASTLLPLRLSAPLCGGKGGFGSQLRAAGGRMQSRKKRSAPAASSSRALGGPRYRVIAEAKALAEYYATQPGLERKEREEKRARWEAVVEIAERKGEEVRLGKGGRLDGKWVEAKEEVEEKMRDAVRRAVEEGEVEMLGAPVVGSDVSGEESEEGGSESDVDERGASEGEKRKGTTGRATQAAQAKTFFGWDEDEDLSSSDDEDHDSSFSDGAVAVGDSKGKGKSKA